MTLFGSGAAPTTAQTWTVLRPVDPEVLQRMLLYESKSAYYLLGYYGEETRCRLLTFPKLTQPQTRLNVIEHARTYSPSEAEAFFQAIHDSSEEEGLQLLCEAYGILGCFRFLEGYYLFLITKRKALGSLAGHTVYGISDTVLIPLGGSHDSWAERRYRKLLLSGVDLTKDFFFSYTYDISSTVQHNLIHKEDIDPFDCMCVWNEYLTRDLRSALLDNKWVLPLVHGSWQQRNLSIFGKTMQLTLISRRSRRFAGTRYLKRGMNQLGWVANEVETEQIVSLQNCSQSGSPSLASVVQLRGSIPLFWGQGTSALNPRPSIQLYNIDPLYVATQKHFDDLFERYGGPIVVLDLVRRQERHPRETILREEFCRAITFLNQHVYGDPIIYVSWDFKARMRQDSQCFLREIEPMMQSCVESTGYCAVNPTSGRSAERAEPQLQQGVMRSNCIDCLDRTNISQYLYGVTALGHQLCSLGLLDTNELDPDCSLAAQLMQMYEIMGNDIALQYGGSEAHGTFFERMRGDSHAATQSRELLRSIKSVVSLAAAFDCVWVVRRYYSNAVSDPEKQDAINLFLGHFVPRPDKADVWELESDYLLHCGVDWEQQHRNFSLRPSCSVSTRPSINESSKMPSTQPLAIEFFPVPIISQTGAPEVQLRAESINKKGASQSSWGFNLWFRSPKETTKFQLPDAKGPVLDSFEELLSVNPVIEVRLHDGKNRRQRGGMQPGFQEELSRMQNQESLTEQGSGMPTLPEIEVASEWPPPGQSCSSSHIQRATSAKEALKRRSSRFESLSDRPVSTKKLASPEFSSLQNDSTFGMVESRQRTKSEASMPALRRRSWFGGLGRRSQEPQSNQNHTSTAHRSLSTPTELEKGVIHHLEPSQRCRTGPARIDPVEEFWDEYWSISEESLTAELTLAEKISKASNKREAARLARSSNALSCPRGKAVGRLTAANVFLDELLDQCLQIPGKPASTEIPSERLTEERIAQGGTLKPTEAKQQSHEETVMGLRSNINELLFCTASGPGDRILEKWHLADQRAEADYYENLSWIVVPVRPLQMDSSVIQV